MKFLSLLKKHFKSGADVYGTRISELKLVAKDMIILDKIFPQTKLSKEIGEKVWKSTFHLSRVLFAYGLLFFLSKIASHVKNYSVEETLLFCGLLSIIMSTGPSVLLSKERIEKLDNIMYSLVFFVKSFTKYSLKDSLCLSNKSSHEIQYKYIVYPYILIAVTGIASLQIVGLFLDETSNFYLILSDLMFFPFEFIESNFAWFQYIGISVLLFFSLIYGPALDIEKTFFEKKEYIKWSKRISIYNCFVAVFHILIIVIPQIYFIENNLHGMTYEKLFSIHFLKVMGPIFFIYLQLWAVIAIHQMITIKYMNNEKAFGLYFLLIVLLFPYFIFFYIFIQLVPGIIIFLTSKLALLYFDIAKFVLKVPSVVRLSGFLIALSVAIYKFMVI